MTEEQPKPGRQPVSAVIISLNAASQIEPCLKSVAFADEILVVDSGSSDETVEIAKRYGTRVIHQDWLGYGKQKQFAVSQATHDWVLCLDIDERVSDELRTSIEEVSQVPRFHAYRMPRCNRFMGRWLRHGEGYPDWSLRLFDRKFAGWSEEDVHEKVHTTYPVGSLKGDLLHESQESLAAYLSKQNHYTSLQAEELFRRGQQISAGKLVVSPLVRFVKFYFFRRGLLDGVPGLVHILVGCFNSFAKHAKLYELNKKRKP